MYNNFKQLLIILASILSVITIVFINCLTYVSASTTVSPNLEQPISTQKEIQQNQKEETINSNNSTNKTKSNISENNIPSTGNKNPNELEIDNSRLSTSAAESGMVLLQNKNETLPISTDKSVAIFGSGSIYTIKGGTGSGDVNPRNTINIHDALKNEGYKITSDNYLNNMKKNYNLEKNSFDKDDKNKIFKTFNYLDKLITQKDFDSSPADVGIYVLSRNSGEGADRKDIKGDYEITDTEFNNIKQIADNYKESILLLNVGGPIDTKFIDKIPNLNSVLLVSQGGQNTGTAVANLLSGKVTPSGKLADTWAYNYSDYPSSKTFADADGNTEQEKYSEGIYVGYRYFDTYNITPHYAFGSGLSYTNFDITTDSVSTVGNKLVTRITVKNIGKKYSGREVVQEYYSAPKGTTDKAFQNLVAYAKTNTLAPGQSQTLTMSFPIYKMASYDTETNSYIMEPGQYLIRIGNSSRNNHVVASLNLPEKVITEQLSSEMAPKVDPTTLHGTNATYIPANQDTEIESSKKITINPRNLNMILGNNKSNFDKNKVNTIVDKNSIQNLPKTDLNETIELVTAANGSKLRDVYNNKITMNQFIASLSTKQLSQIVNGSVNMNNNQLKAFYNMIKNGVDKLNPNDIKSDSNTQEAISIIGNSSAAVAGAAGQTTSALTDRGIPLSVNADGPAGIRLTPLSKVNDTIVYHYATAWPIGTLLAQTWDPEIIYQIGKATGKELKEFGIDTWLAPGMNIHRNPLNGRNFEYYSEDPLITGISATAMTKGVQTNRGVGTTVKHFFGNNQESSRQTTNDEIGEQAMREIYLKGFETVVKDAQPQYIMSSYNQVNRQYTAENYDLLTNILRGEWGYKGTVMTDWFNLKSLSEPWKLMHAGNDLIMPGGTQEALEIAASNSINGNKLALGDLQKSASRVLNTIMKTYTYAKNNNLPEYSYTPKNTATTMTINGNNW